MDMTQFMLLIQSVAVFLFGVITLTATVATIAGFMRRSWWILESASHFRVQYLLVLSLAILILLLLKQRVMAAGLSLFALINLALVLPFYFGRVRVHGKKSFRILMANVLYDNQSHENVRQFIRNSRPDIIVLEEVTPRWIKELAPIEADYPYTQKSPRTDAYGIAFYCRIPFTHAEIRCDGPSQLPAVYAWFDLDGRSLTLVGTHPRPPLSQVHLEDRNGQLADLIDFVQKQEGAVIVTGDLNATPWSPFFADLIAQTGLRDARKGFGLYPTWPAESLTLRVPLDHCLVSREVKIHSFRTGPYVGSDHLPILIDFSLAGR